MADIRKPKDPQVTDDTVGPNWPGTTDPGFGDQYRDKGGDTVPAGDYAGRREPKKIMPWDR